MPYDKAYEFLFLLDYSTLQFYIDSVENIIIGGIQNADHPSGKANAFGYRA